MIWMLAATAFMIVGRFTVPGHGLSWPGTFEAFSHMIEGALLTFCFTGPKKRCITANVCFWGSALFELAMFLTR